MEGNPTAVKPGSQDVDLIGGPHDHTGIEGATVQDIKAEPVGHVQKMQNEPLQSATPAPSKGQ